MNENTIGSNITPPSTSQIYTPQRNAWEDKTNQAIKIYISYSESDEKEEKELEAHLTHLQRQGLIECWNTQQVEAGSKKDEVIKNRLNTAQIILFLVSANFMASERYEKEVLPALARYHTSQYVYVIPLLIHAYDWKHTAFGELQPLPRNAEPVYSGGNTNTIWSEIVTELRYLCEKLKANHIDKNKPASKALSSPFTTIPAPDTKMMFSTGTIPQTSEAAYTATIISKATTRATFAEIRSRQYTHLETIAENTMPIWSLAFSPDGQYLASNSTNDTTIKLWDMRTKSCHHSLKNYVNMTSGIAFSPDGQYLASGSDDGSIKLWNYGTSKIEKALQGHTEWITSIVFSADGQYLASGSDDGSIKIWNVPRMSRSKQIQEQGAVSRIAFVPNKQLVACAIYNQAVKLWDISIDPPQIFKELPIKASSLIFSPNGEYLVVGNENGAIEIWETRHWKQLQSLTKHTGKIRNLAFHPNSSLLASGGDDRNIQIWDVISGEVIQTLTKHTDRIESIAFSPHGQFIASGGRDTNIQFWGSL